MTFLLNEGVEYSEILPWPISNAVWKWMFISGKGMQLGEPISKRARPCGKCKLGDRELLLRLSTVRDGNGVIYLSFLACQKKTSMPRALPPCEERVRFIWFPQRQSSFTSGRLNQDYFPVAQAGLFGPFHLHLRLDLVMCLDD